MITEKLNQKVLSVHNLIVEYPIAGRAIQAVNSINFEIFRGETLGLIGESGSGKTTAAMAILNLLQKPGRVTAGKILLKDDIDLLSLNEPEFRKLRWKELALISQGSMNSLNPTMRIKDQIADGILAHEDRHNKEELRDRVMSLLGMVGLPERVYSQYPHELSGGMKQRVSIAMAVSLNPSLVIADEPTSALDVISQRVVAQTLIDIKDRLGISMLFIGHDIGLIAQVADRIAVMYSGFIVEIGSKQDVLASPKHLYTQLLIESMPSITHRKPLKAIDDAARKSLIKSLRIPLPMREVSPGHWVADSV